MNRKQLIVWFAAVALALLSELFPPWMYEDSWNSAEQSAGHHFVLSPDPEVKSDAEMRRMFSITDESRPLGFGVRKDIARVYGYRVMLFFIPSGLLLLLDDSKSLPKLVLGGLSLCVGLCAVSLFLLYMYPRWN